MSRGDVPFKVLEQIGGIAYKLELSKDMNVSATFNRGDLTSYVRMTLKI